MPSETGFKFEGPWEVRYAVWGEVGYTSQPYTLLFETAKAVSDPNAAGEYTATLEDPNFTHNYRALVYTALGGRTAYATGQRLTLVSMTQASKRKGSPGGPDYFAAFVGARVYDATNPFAPTEAKDVLIDGYWKDNREQGQPFRMKKLA